MTTTAYLDFIEKCREKEKNYSSEDLQKCQTHHIVPRHHYKANQLPWKTFDLENNRVQLTFEDHVKAHKIRFETYGEFGDLLAYQKMESLTKEGFRAMQKAGGQVVNLKFKREGRMMYNSEFQKEMAKRSIARPDAREIRSDAGKKGNRKRHQNRTVKKEDAYLWFFQKTPFLCTFGFDNGGDLCKELNRAQPTKLQRVWPLIKGHKKSLYGWSCEKIVRP